MTNYISFSLFGNHEKYILGAIENARRIPEVYPGWKFIMYCGNSIDLQIQRQLRDLGAEVQLVGETENHLAMLWRFRAAFLQDVDHVIFRDTDSLVSFREANAVAEWIKSGRDLHIIRDHPFHTEAIMGGMWGVRPRALAGREELISHVGYPTTYGADQVILRRKFYRNKRLTRLVHDSYFVREWDSRNLPRATDGSFIGEVIDQFGNFDSHSRGIVNSHRSSRLFRFRSQATSLVKICRDFAYDYLRG